MAGKTRVFKWRTGLLVLTAGVRISIGLKGWPDRAGGYEREWGDLIMTSKRTWAWLVLAAVAAAMVWPTTADAGRRGGRASRSSSRGGWNSGATTSNYYYSAPIGIRARSEMRRR